MRFGRRDGGQPGNGKYGKPAGRFNRTAAGGLSGGPRRRMMPQVPDGAKPRWSSTSSEAVTGIETIAVGGSIRELSRLRRAYGSGRWRKRKGVACVRFADGTECRAEVHWYEAHGIGRREMKIKRLLGDRP